MNRRPPPHPNRFLWHDYLTRIIPQGDPALKRAVESANLDDLIKKLCLTGKKPPGTIENQDHLTR